MIFNDFFRKRAQKAERTKEIDRLREALSQLGAMIFSGDPQAYPKAAETLERAQKTGDASLILQAACKAADAARRMQPQPDREAAREALQLAVAKARALKKHDLEALLNAELQELEHGRQPAREEPQPQPQPPAPVAAHSGGRAAQTVDVGAIPAEANYSAEDCAQESAPFSEAEIDAEDDAIGELLKAGQTNAAYARAAANLRRARQTENDRLLMYCAVTFGFAADEHGSVGTLQEVIDCYRLAAAKADLLGKKRTYAASQTNLGNAYRNLPGKRRENIERAIACYHAALTVCTPTDFREYYAWTQINLGIAYRNLPGKRRENIERAIACYQEALTVFTPTAFRKEYALTQMNLGVAYYNLPDERLKNLPRAFTCYYKALQIFTARDFPALHAMIKRNNLDLAYQDLLRCDDARAACQILLESYEQALEMFPQAQYPQEHAEFLYYTGLAYRDMPPSAGQGNPQDALEWFRRALAGFSADLFPEKRIQILRDYASACLPRDPQLAYDALAGAIELLETRLRASAFPKKCHVMAQDTADLYHCMADVCHRMGRYSALFCFAERGKSRTLVERLYAQQVQTPQSAPPDLRRAYNELRRLLHETQQDERAAALPFDVEYDATEGDCRIRRIELENRAEFPQPRQIELKLREIQNDLLPRLRRAAPEFASSERVPQIIVEEVEALLPDATLLIECFCGKDGTYLVLIDNDDTSSNVLLKLPALTIDRLNELTHQEWLTPYRESNNLSDAEWLRIWQETKQNPRVSAWQPAFDALLKHLAAELWQAQDEHGSSLAKQVARSGAERLIFIPHCGLHLLPLHLIPLPNGERLLDRYEIVYAPSATMLQFILQRPARRESQLVAFADPDRSLWFSSSEVLEIERQSIWDKQPKIFFYENASKAALRDHAAQADLLHLSCHGNFNFDDPLDSCLKLAGADADAQENLSLREIFADLSLPSGATVVLSACESGMVQLEIGDEYIGLPAGFFYVGASCVISSLWAVDDLSTSLLMQRWYTNVFQGGMGRAQALRNAQTFVKDLTVKEIRANMGEQIESIERRAATRDANPEPATLLSQRDKLIWKRERFYALPETERPFTHPYYWGAFTCVGNWD